MNFIMLFEEFNNKTLNKNKFEYNKFLNKFGRIGDRSGVVAWTIKGSQERNFKIVSKYIKNGDSILDYGCGIGDFLKYLEENNYSIKDYLGVDINKNFIDIAKKSYKDNDFKYITDIDQIVGKWDDVCAIGVFTWYITKDEFIETIYKLLDLSNKQVILTLLSGYTPYSDIDIKTNEFNYWDDDNQNENFEKREKEYWEKEYRFYDESLFNVLFPDLNISYDYDGSTIFINIKK